jgi:cadmium resistance protein CadD (predicted permease)
MKFVSINQTKEQYGEDYQKNLFEQYKLCIEMADRISARRALANSFFMGLHTTLVTIFTILIKENILSKTLIGYIPFIPIFLMCYVWYKLLISYQQLNTGKFKVILELENLMPVNPYNAEWKALGEGNDSKLYEPLTNLEKFIPIIFGVIYILIGIIIFYKNNTTL